MAAVAMGIKGDCCFTSRSAETNDDCSYHDDTKVRLVSISKENSVKRKERVDAYGNVICLGNKDINTKHHITFVDQITNGEFCTVCIVDSYKRFNKRLIGEFHDDDTIKVCCKGSCLPY